MSRAEESDPAEIATDPSDRIEVILVRPQGPRNVGSTARAMRNFGLKRLVIVGDMDPLHEEARMMGVHAEDVLAGARRESTLSAALSPATWIVATTSKPRDRVVAYHPRELAPKVLEEAARGHVAIVFGPEDHGLDGDALRSAHACLSIPTAPECRALNLSQAVLLCAYEIHVARTAQKRVDWSFSGRLMHADMRTELHRELTRAVIAAGIQHEGTEKACQDSLERLLALGPMQSRDARLLFALARRVQQLVLERSE